MSLQRLLLSVGFILIALGAEEVDLSGFEDEPSTQQIASEQTSPQEDALLEGFDDEPIEGTTDKTPPLVEGLTGKVTQQIAYAPHGDSPHQDITSIKSSLLLDYEYKFDNGIHLKFNAKSYWDAIYALKGRSEFSQDERNELESEIELFDGYIEGSITDRLDFKFGHQVVVWGRSDTIRVTDVLNPIDNRRPGMVDIENLRLPVTMAKFDYFIGDWRITPIAIFEQRFTKNPPFASAFYPVETPAPNHETYHDFNYALSIGGEFTGWDINFYASRLRDDDGHIVLTSTPKIAHERVTIVGSAINLLQGSWLFKSEFAYFDGLKYTSAPNKTFSRSDLLLGFEYAGIADTSLSYDVVGRYIDGYDRQLRNELNPLHKQNYQHAFRLTSDFMHKTVTANYLLSLFGKQLDEGGFQRAWLKYEIAQDINTNIGIVDYRGGSVVFDTIKDNDMLFVDISYNF